jgi:hypothetical protein
VEHQDNLILFPLILYGIFDAEPRTFVKHLKTVSVAPRNLLQLGSECVGNVVIEHEEDVQPRVVLKISVYFIF